ncbi:RNA polymerase sigma factor [Microbacterium sp. NPDC008134]|uniref:RNA polymerase sigma factor n=1 Tax=Microbacterium sp. NPDC008134 TaxID=3364183 RepID=UPI0036E7441C
MSMRSARAADERLEDALIANEADMARYFRRRMDNAADADDVYGDFLLTAWKIRRKIPEAHDDARLWLFGVARNVLMNSRRAANRRKSAGDRLTSLLRHERPPVELDTVLDVRAALAALDPDAAELVRLIYWDGLRSHEAARVLGINPSTARSRLSEAKRRLRNALGANTGPTKTLGPELPAERTR